MKHGRYKIKGFTLVELLVVISILAALIGLVFPNFMAARERARDSQRKSDLFQIQKALELYQQDNNSSFPADNNEVPWGDTWKNASGLITYMNKVPQDPMNSSDQRIYFYKINNGGYSLCACLENPVDIGDNVIDCSAADCSCGSSSASKCYLLNYQ